MTFEDLTKWVAGFAEFKSCLTPEVKVILAPSFVHIPTVFELSQKTNMEVAAQDVSLEERGAHTGEAGAFQLKDFCNYAIVGHSERQESLEVVMKKRDGCLKNGITPIVCFVNPEDLPSLYKEETIIAWEDPQNISKNGVYHVEDPEKIAEIVQEIRKLIPANAVLIYGGSVNENNIKDIAKIQELDGVLVGNASLDPKTFASIIAAYTL